MYKALLKKLFLLSFLSIFFYTRIFEIDHINPNFPLLFFVFLMLNFDKSETFFNNQFKDFVLFLLFFLLLSYFFSGFVFWQEMLIFSLILFLLFFIKKFLFSNLYLDGLFLIIIFSALFYGISAIFFFAPFSLANVVKEIFYNYLCFLFFIFLTSLKSLKKIKL
jgi:hypothetical protein